jgi:hypothetical protein
MKQFLDSNSYNKSRAIYIVGGWYGSELPFNINPKGGIPDWQMEHIGMAARVTPDRRPLGWKEFKEEIATFNVTEEAIPPVKYDRTTWEYNIRSGLFLFLDGLERRMILFFPCRCCLFPCAYVLIKGEYTTNTHNKA